METIKEQIKSSKNNKILAKDYAIHEWYRFVLSFPPHLVRDYLKRFGINEKHRVLDPFCGTGTTIVECKKRNIPGVGIESNPIACFAGRTKVNWKIDPDGLMEHAQKIADIAYRKLKEEGSGEGDVEDLPLFSTEFPNAGADRLRSLPDKTQKLLIKNSISPLPLNKVLLLIELLSEYENSKFVNHEKLALAKGLVNGISNLRFGPEVGVGKIKTNASVISIWLKYVRTMAEDIRNWQWRDCVAAEVHQGDSRRISEVLEPNSIDAVITSPPYPNEKDYTRTTRLESVLLGFITSKKELRDLKKLLVRSNTRGVYKNDRDDSLIEENPEIKTIADEIEKRRIELNKTSGFERLYPRVTKLYFGGMLRHLADLRTILKPNARLAYVVGDQASYLRVLIRTGKILGGISKSLGYEVEGIDLFRTRAATATKKQLREEVLLLRWPGN